MTRKLVTIRKVLDIIPIKGADRIELIKIGGWQVVSQKGLHEVNDLVLYFEIDSFLPMKEPFLDFAKGGTKKMNDIEGIRIRTIKLRKELSQGIILSLSHFPNIDFTDTKKDYSSIIGVIKWEPPINPQLAGIIEGRFPYHLVPKTTQERVQNMTKTLAKNTGIELEFTEKMHGQSMTVFRHEESVSVCSRNLELKYDANNILWQTAERYKLIENLKVAKGNYAFQGELCGPGINKNMYNYKNHKFLIFDVYDIDEQRYFGRQEIDDICKEFKLDQVPFLGTITLGHTSDELLDMADGNSKTGQTIREGLVFKDLNRKFSFKVISNEFLLRKNE